jgi:hypothetical protein
MSLRILKEHLPWIAPTTAIVLAATGVINLGPKDAVLPASDFDTVEVSRNITQNPVAIGGPSDGIAPLSAGSVEAVQAAVLQAPTTPDLIPTPVEPAVVAPTTPPVEPQTVSIEPVQEDSPTSNPGAFFCRRSGQAGAGPVLC